MNIIFPTIAIIILILIIEIVRKKIDLFGVYIFLMTFHTVKFNIGLNLFIYQVIMIFLIISTLLKLIMNKKVTIFNTHNTYLSLFILLAIIITLFFSITTDIHNSNVNFFRGNGRFIGQIILLFLSFSIVPIAFNYIKNADDVYRYTKIFIGSIIVLCFLGLLQWLIYQVTGNDIFPLRLNSEGIEISGKLTVSGNSLFRMSSLGGEPKQFSISLLLGFFLIYIANNFKIYFFKYDYIIKYLFLIISFLTLSTSVYILFVILTFFTVIIKLFFFGNRFFRYKKRDVFFGTFIILILTYIIINNYDSIYEIYKLRILDRHIIGEDFDYVIQQFLLHYPSYLVFGTGLGNIHNYAYPYIYEEVAFYMNGAIFSAKSGYLRIISEVGIVGLFLFGMYNVYILQNLKNKLCFGDSDNQKINNILFFFLLLVLIAYLARVTTFSMYMSFFAVANAYIFSQGIKHHEG